MNPKCQLCIRVTLVILAIFTVVHIILAILKAVFTKDIITQDVMMQLLSMFMTQTEKDGITSLFNLLSIVFALVTMAAVIPRLCMFVSLKCCPNSCCPKFFVCLAFVLTAIVMIIFFMLGSVFGGLSAIFSQEEVERQCKMAQTG